MRLTTLNYSNRGLSWLKRVLTQWKNLWQKKTRELWMNKDKLRLDVSWLWFVVWLLCFMCWIMTNWYLMHSGYYMFCGICAHCVKFCDFGTFAMYRLYLVIVYLLIFLALLTVALLYYFVIPFFVWQLHHHFCNDHQDKIQYYILYYYYCYYCYHYYTVWFVLFSFS